MTIKESMRAGIRGLSGFSSSILENRLRPARKLDESMVAVAAHHAAKAAECEAYNKRLADAHRRAANQALVLARNEMGFMGNRWRMESYEMAIRKIERESPSILFRRM